MAEQSREQDILQSVTAHLKLAVLVKTPDTDSLQLIGNPPDWFASTFGEADTLPSKSPFLSEFVAGVAQDCWNGDFPKAESGYWEETDENGQPAFFQATAFREANQDLLLISQANESHHRERRYLQHAHDVELHQRSLAKERERKEILLDCIVHELSKPVSTILMNIQFVEAQLEREDLLKALARAGAQAEAQRDLIHSISHTFGSDLSPFDPSLLAQQKGVLYAPLVEEAIKSLNPLSQEQGITIKLEKTASLSSVRVLAEEKHLARVLENSLERAIRHAPPNGEISVQIENQDDFVRTSIFHQTPDKEPLPSREDSNAFLKLRFCKMAIGLWGGRIEQETTTNQESLWFELKKHTNANDLQPSS